MASFGLSPRRGVLAAAEFVTTAAIDAAEAQEPQLTWEYRTEQEWAGLTVRDDTANLTTSGAVEFLAPADFVPHSEMETKAWWMRVRWDAGDFDTLPRSCPCPAEHNDGGANRHDPR